MNKNNIIKGKDLERYFELNKRLFDFSKFFSYDAGDDRTIVIIGASFIEYVLEQILLAFFPDNEPEVEKLLKFDQPLGTFGNRVRMIYCLGLIDKVIWNDLKLIGKIRNRFAHDLYASFNDDQIKTYCKDLRWHRQNYMHPPPDATTRDLYQVGVNTVITYLNGIASLARTEKRHIKNNI